MWQPINDGRPVLTFSAESIVLDNSSHDIEIDDVIEEIFDAPASSAYKRLFWKVSIKLYTSK